jgi:hypothetical protein
MQELRFVAVSEDGRYAVLAVPGRSARFTLPIDERLRAVALGQTSRLVQYEIEVESPLRPKEIQARIRAGETVEEIADAAGIAVERVRWFEGPVLAERAYVADQAQRSSVRRPGDATPSTPGPPLGEIVAERLKAVGSEPDDAQWDAKKRGDGSWQVQLTFISGGRLHVAEWVFDPRRRHVLPADDNAARMSLPGGEPPLPAAPLPGEATVTQLAPRLSPAASQGFGQPATGTAGPGHGGSGNGSRPRTASAARPAEAPRSSEAARPDEAPRSSEAARPAEARPAEARAAERPAAAQASRAAEAAAPGPTAPPVTPAAVAAQAPKVPRAPQPSRGPQRSRGPHPSRGPEPARGSEPPAAPGPQAASPAEARPEPVEPEPAVPAEPGGEQARRQARKTARNKRASVPSWDEIMFGNARQRD